MILHILRDCEELTRQIIFDIRENYKDGGHLFYLYGMPGHEPVQFDYENDVVHESPGNIGSRLKELIDKADRVLLHGIDNDIATIKRLRIYIKAQKAGKKFVWFEWGHDLYDAYWNSHRKAREEAGIVTRKNRLVYLVPHIEEHYRRKLIENLHLILCIKEDRPFIEKWYHTRAGFVHWISMVYGRTRDPVLPYKRNEILHVIIGHCPSPLCRFEEVLSKLRTMDDGKMLIYATLFHQGERTEYIGKIIALGERLFGKRFVPIEEHLSYDRFALLMNDMDVGIYNQNRQMARGNIQLLLHYGKKVFVSSENTMGEAFRRFGCTVYDIGELNRESLFSELSCEDRKRNSEIIENGLSPKTFVQEWNKVLTG